MTGTPNPVLLIATRNPGKVREIAAVLSESGDPVLQQITWRSLDEAAPDAADPEEDQPTFAGNAALKARYWSKLTGLRTLADDSGLEVDALSGAPGVYSARYAAGPTIEPVGRAAQDAANNRKLIAALQGVPLERRTARFRCCLAVADGDRILATAEGAIEGMIIENPRGAGGFGYDPYFLVPSLGQTTAELPFEHKNRISHRGQALRALQERLARLF